MRICTWKMAALAPTPDSRALLLERIRVQGDVVRQMKKDKKPKEEVGTV